MNMFEFRLGHGVGNVNRQRRQLGNENNRHRDVRFNSSNNPNSAISRDRNNQQQSNRDFLRSSQGQIRPDSRDGFYNDPDFKLAPFSGEKPVNWLDTKYPNWVSYQLGQSDKNKMVGGKNATPNRYMIKF